MDNPLLWFFIAAVAAVVVSILVTRAIVRGRLSSGIARLESDLEHLRSDKEGLQKELSSLKEGEQERVRKAVEEASAAKDEVIAARDKAHNEAMATLREQFADALSQMKVQAKDATDELLRSRQKEFRETSAEAIGNLLSPVREKIEELRKEMKDNSQVHRVAESSIKSDVQTLMDYTGRVAHSTDELTAAFKYGNKIQGTWGETILEELLTSQGLTKGVHFDVQPTLSGSADGRPLRPDVIIHLDRRREVIVDAKTSMKDYIAYVNAESEEERARCLKAHIDSIKSHVKELSDKKYAAFIQPPKMSAGYVIMFVPNMGALWTALNAAPDLWRWAADQNVYIADEQSLYGALKIVQLTWTQVAQAENHEKVFRLADEMMDRVEKFLESYEAVGTALKNAAAAYEDGRRKLAPGGHSICTTAAKLAKLGAKKGKHIEKALVDVEDIALLEEGDRE